MDFGKCAANLKSDLKHMISQRLAIFEKETGVTPCDIDVRIFENTTMADASRGVKRFLVGNVDVRFDL